MDIYKAAGIIIKDRKLLFARAKDMDFFIDPGGKIEKGETAEQALSKIPDDIQVGSIFGGKVLPRLHELGLVD